MVLLTYNSACILKILISVLVLMLTVLFFLIFFVSLGFIPGGVRRDYGTHQLLCHCHHVGTGLLTLSAPPPFFFQIKHKSKEREKHAKETEYWIRQMLISITSGRLFLVKVFSVFFFSSTFVRFMSSKVSISFELILCLTF